MPVREHRVAPETKCDCCGEFTRKCTGVADTAVEQGIPYLARWNPNSLEGGIAFLVALGEGLGFTSVLYRFESNSFMICDPEDYDWHNPTLPIASRGQVIGTPLAARTFRVLDEIWQHDPVLKSWVTGLAKDH
ncbi:hypothetical protein OJ996_14770 [Luteolibacter sp. GHJ8]|uniref:Uncharacterized protein n=1 Tax=Luteolibacter rhizosphaerae TaxID=2989719 RepID=A0ABT3G4U0_9BACT|nr:hypothetical protein [Luteolibacter rhizosphaerae]MCW1914848.1 hypothetical protein [Luteolibacter rhizosphaerae]